MPIRKKITSHPLFIWLRTSPMMKTLVVAIPMTWHCIVIAFFGERLKFLDSEGITTKGIVITIAIYSFVVLYTLIINVIDRIQIKQEIDYSSISTFVLDKIKFLYNEKLDNQKDTFLTPNLTTPFSYDVVKRINVILRELIHCIEYSSDIDADHISAALFYSFDNEDEEWYLAEKNYCDAFDGEIRDAVMHPESFALFLKNYKANDFYFLNNKYKDGVCYKQNGTKTPIYKMNERDIEVFRRTGKYGSIVGWKFVIKHNAATYIQAMLFISTYGVMLDKSIFGGHRKIVERNIKKLILPYFQMNFQAELMHLYRENNRNH